MPRGTKKTPKKKPRAIKPRKTASKANRQKLNCVKVPKQFEPIFARAQEFVGKYFSTLKGDASEGTIEVGGERYLLVRAASMSVDFFETVKDLYKGAGEEEALSVARNLLFDIAHAIGKADAKSFQKKMKLEDPVDKLSAGPVHFAYSGWAFVDIFPESRPTPDENYYLIYDHPFSFESAAWLKAKKKSSCPVCIMNAGYSSGWCEESYNIPLVAQEIMCKASGDKVCRFIMAPPSKIEEHIKRYVKKKPALARRVGTYEVPGFFRRKEIEQNLRASQARLEASEARYRAVVDNVGIGISLISPQMEILTLNKQMKSWFPHIDVSNRPTCYESFNDPPRDEICSYCPTCKTLEDGEVHEGVTSTPAGKEVRNYRIVSSPIFDANGKVEAAIEMVEDITERKKMEEELRAARNNMEQRVELRTAELRRSQQLYQTLAEAAEDYIFIIRPDMTVQYVNEFGAKALKRSKDGVIGKGLSALFPSVASRGMEEAIKRVFSTGEAVSAEKPLQFPDGEIWLHTHLVPLKDEKGAVTSVMGLSRDITERRGYEESLRLTQTTMDHVGNAIYWMGPDARFVYVNDQACKQLGYSRNELLAMNVLDIDPTFTKKTWPEHWADLKERGSFVIESVHRRKDGSEFPIEVMVNYLEHEGREVNCAIVLDITARKEAERALRESEARLRTAVESLPFDFFIIGADGRYAMVNTPCTGNWGDIIGKRPEDVGIDKETLKIWQENNRRAFKGEVVRGEVEMVVHGKTKHFYNIVAPIRDEGKIYGVLACNLDITERKMAEEALKESERRFQQVAESAEEWIWEINEHGLYTYSNEVVEEILGYKPEELVGMMHFYDFFVPGEREELKKAAFEIMNSKERFKDFVNINVHKEGKEVILETSGTAIINKNGYLKGYRGVDTDITERKKAEESLRSALKIKSEFMAMMSHELRTPLTRIITSTHLVLRDRDVALPEKRVNNLNNVLSSSDALLLMINNVLEMARLEGGSVPIIAQDCDLHHMIQTSISGCEGMTEEKDVKFVTNIDDTVASIYTDKEKLGHILMNLICNSIRYSDRGTIEITAKPSKIQGCVDIAVSDEGIGIPYEKIPHLFEPFKQFEEIAKRRPGGIGLGLAIVKANLELIEGSIDVKSEVGKGSTFTVTIPKEPSKEDDGG